MSISPLSSAFKITSPALRFAGQKQEQPAFCGDSLELSKTSNVPHETSPELAELASALKAVQITEGKASSPKITIKLNNNELVIHDDRSTPYKTYGQFIKMAYNHDALTYQNIGPENVATTVLAPGKAPLTLERAKWTPLHPGDVLVFSNGQKLVVTEEMTYKHTNDHNPKTIAFWGPPEN